MFALLFLFSLLVAQNTAKDVVVGYWRSTTGDSSKPPQATRGFAYDGSFITEALHDSEAIKKDLPKEKVLVIGGPSKRWCKEEIDKVVSSVKSGAIGKAGYCGVMWFLEQGESGLTPGFLKAFAEVKQAGLENWVSFPHTTPFGFPETEAMLKKFLDCGAIDYISPQLYTDVTETEPDFSTANGIAWSDYQDTKAKIVPSILSCTTWEAVFCYFQNHNLDISGYLERLPSGAQGGAKVAFPHCPKIEEDNHPKSALSCGKNRIDALQCGKPCPGGTNIECPNGQQCFAVKCQSKKGNLAGATEGTVVTEIKNPDGSITTTTITTSDEVPGYAVALLVFASLVIVVLFILIVMVSTRKKPERV